MRSLGGVYLGSQGKIRSIFTGNCGRFRPNRRTKFFLPLSPSLFQCLLNAMNHDLAYAGGIAKAHFAFRRVNIHIDTARIEFNKKKRDRVLPFHKRRVVAFADGPSDEAAFNGAAIYEHELLAAVLSTQTCLTNKTADFDFRRGSPVENQNQRFYWS